MLNLSRVGAAITAIVILAAASVGQELETGFVVVAPVSGFGDGLMLSERLTNSVGGMDFESTVWPSAIVTRADFVVNSDAQTNQSTGIALVNPGSSDVMLTLTLRNQQGGQIGTATMTLKPLQQVSRFVGELFGRLPASGVTGLLSITATGPIAVGGLVFRGSEFSSIPTTAAGAGASLLIPQFAAGAGWSSDIVVANRLGTPQVVRLDFHNPAGRIVRSVANVNVPANGVVVISAARTSAAVQ